MSDRLLASKSATARGGDSDVKPAVAPAAIISRHSSLTSLGSCSSVPNSDDEDSDSRPAVANYKDRRREAHTQAEQKRRDSIKRGYEDLQKIVPTCQSYDGYGATKLSKASVLAKSIDYIQLLTKQKRKQEVELDKLRKEVMALKIMKANYEHIVKAHQKAPSVGESLISDEDKFRLFQQIMESLFVSFDHRITVTDFAELSAQIINWLEEYCKPQMLRDVAVNSFQQATSQQHCAPRSMQF